MTQSSRDRLARLVRHAECDLAEAALLCCVEIDPELDVASELLRLDALADGMLTKGFRPGSPQQDAEALASYLGGDLDFRGHGQRGPTDGLLTHVLDDRRGLPITLSIVYVAIARRLRIPAFGIALPGHFVVGIGADDRPVVIDPFHRGIRLEEASIGERVKIATGGDVDFRRSMLRPASPPVVIRRVLNNLTHDFALVGDHENALWTVDLKLLIPGASADDHRVRGDLLVQSGQYLRGAMAYERYLELAGPDAVDTQDIRHKAIAARAKLN